MAVNFFPTSMTWKRQKAKLKLWLSSLVIQSLNRGLWLLWASIEFFEVHFRFLTSKSRQMIGRGVGEEVWVSGFKWMRSFCSFPISQTADVTRWEWILSLFWFPSYNPSAFPLLPLGNLWSLQNHLSDNHSYRQQTHTLPHWNSLTQELKALVHNRFKYKHVFLPFIIFSPL